MRNACVQVETSFNSDSRDENDRLPRTVTVYEFERRGSRRNRAGCVEDRTSRMSNSRERFALE